MEACRLRDIQDIFMGTALGPGPTRLSARTYRAVAVARSRMTVVRSLKKRPASPLQDQKRLAELRRKQAKLNSVACQRHLRGSDSQSVR